MAKLQTMEEFAKKAVDLALDEFEYEGKTIREWTELILNGELTDVVRCKDCKHCDPENHHCDHHMGTATPLKRKPDDFCSYGERKEGAD